MYYQDTVTTQEDDMSSSSCVWLSIVSTARMIDWSFMLRMTKIDYRKMYRDVHKEIAGSIIHQKNISYEGLEKMQKKLKFHRDIL